MEYRSLHYVLVGAIMIVLSSTQAGCAEHKIGDKTVQDVFTDPQLQALAQAACAGNEAGIAHAIKTGADPNGKGLDEVAPLFWAVSCQNLVGIEALLKAGANPNYAFKNKFTVVYVAATMSNSKILKLLLKYGGDPNAKDNYDNKTALAQAFDLGIDDRWDNYYILLDAGADINYADETGWTIANIAGALGRFDKVAELLERGYRYDLPNLGRTVQTRHIDPESPQAAWQEKVKMMLEQKGVRFPVPPKVFQPD